MSNTLRLLVMSLLLNFLQVGTSAATPSMLKSAALAGDSLTLKAKKLKHLYMLAKNSSGQKEINEENFFNEFPGTFNELNLLYGYIENKPAPLYEESELHILGLFNTLTAINDTVYYKKIISIAIGGHWDADAINFFQHGLEQRVITKPELTVSILKKLPNSQISSFWYFYFDGPHPQKQIDPALLKIKLIDKKVFDLMIKSQAKVLSEKE